MKRNFVIITLALAFMSIGSAYAQSTANQSVTISFPNKAAIATSGTVSTLTLTDVDPLTGTWTPATDANTSISQVNNYGTNGAPLKITSEYDVDLTSYNLMLQLTAAMDAGNSGTGAALVDLSDATSKDLITGLERGFSRFDLTYTLSATSSEAEAINTPLAGTVTFTITQ